jgi:hypothetical protein
MDIVWGMKTCPKHPDKKVKARGMCHSCYQGWRRKNTATGKAANQRNKRLEVKRRKKKNQDWTRELKEKTPCADCKKFFPYWCMQFDHIEGSKKFGISGNLSRTLPILQKELSKCKIVCATCHAHRTYCRVVGIEHYILVPDEKDDDRKERDPLPIDQSP